jgi:flagella basal body P-ring formation protein FlgA
MLMMLFYILSIFNSYESLPTEIRAKLESEFNSYKKVEFSVVKSVKQYKSIVLKEGENINVIGSTAYIPVNVVDRNGKNKRTTLSVRVKIFEDVFVAVENIDKWSKLKSTDFQLVEKEVTSVRGDVVESIGEIIGKRADRYIKKGDVLTSEAIEEMPVVFPDDKLDACSIVGNVKVSFFVFAKQEGTVGDVIRVRNSDNKIYKAEIIDYKNVLIVE